MDKKAKILATLGPAIFKKNIINNLIRSGVDGFRINFSHNLTGIEKIVKIIRDCEKVNSKPIAIVADLQGIKLRIGKIFGNQVSLKRGDIFNGTFVFNFCNNASVLWNKFSCLFDNF